MEEIHIKRVKLISQNSLSEKAEKTFLLQKAIIIKLLPEADIQHVGSSAIPNSITKGDLDIQVRVDASLFTKAVQELSRLYELNEGSTKTESFRAFKDDSVSPPLGVQLTVIGSEFDIFWKFRDILLMNDQYRKEYDQLKAEFEGKNMESYREAKNEFFGKLMESSEYQMFDK